MCVYPIVMPLHPDALKVLDFFAKNRPTPSYQLPIEEGRQIARDNAVLNGELVPVAKVEARIIPGDARHGDGADVPVRIYWPRVLAEEERIPVTLFFHGGGWVFGDLESHDNVARRLAVATGSVVVAVHYRLAPEHRFPKPVDDAYTVLRWLKDNAPFIGGDRRKIAVAGDSAGANIAAALCLKARDQYGPTIAAQVLVYPVADYWDAGFPSYTEKAEGYGLTKAAMQWFWDHYLGPDGDTRHPYASPLRAEFVANLPPALVLTAEYDPLHDEAVAYADRLEGAGNIVVRREFPGQIHGFFAQSAMNADADVALDACAVFLKRVWSVL